MSDEEMYTVTGKSDVTVTLPLRAKFDKYYTIKNDGTKPLIIQGDGWLIERTKYGYTCWPKDLIPKWKRVLFFWRYKRSEVPYAAR